MNKFNIILMIFFFMAHSFLQAEVKDSNEPTPGLSNESKSLLKLLLENPDAIDQETASQIIKIADRLRSSNSDQKSKNIEPTQVMTFEFDDDIDDEDLKVIEVVSHGDGDVVDNSTSNKYIRPWSQSMSRGVWRILTPGTETLKKGDKYFRVMHTSKNSVNGDEGDDFFHNILGLEDKLSIGLEYAQGLTNWLELNVRRTNGRSLFIEVGKNTSFDYWDILFKANPLAYFDVSTDQRRIDLAFIGGTTWMMRDDFSGDFSLDLGIVAEMPLFEDRFRLGGGVLYSSLSTYESASEGPLSKLHPDEVATYRSLGSTVIDPKNDTLSISFSATYAINRDWQIFAEGIQPMSGFETGEGMSQSVGFRLNTNTHQYHFYFSNTPNNSFNSVLTGGHKLNRLDLFGFNISSFF